jgi:hypothetical protein
MIAATYPRLAIRSRQQRAYLGSSEKTHEWTWLALIGNRQDALDQSGVLGRFQSSIAEE